MKIKSLLMLLALLTTSSIFAPFYRGSIWKGSDAQGHEHFVYCFGDIHLAHSSNILQRQQLPAIFKRCGATNIHGIVEDMPNLTHGTYSPRIWTGGLFNITEPCLAEGVKTENVEFRRASCNLNYHIGDLILKGSTNYTYLTKKELTQSIDEILNTYFLMRNRIATYNGSEKFKKTWCELTQKTIAPAQELAFFLKEISSLNDNETLSRKKYLKLHTLICQLEWPILDIEILRSLHENDNYKHNFIFVGLSHIEILEQILPKLGFLKVKDFGSTTFPKTKNEFVYLDLQQCFDAFFAEHPEALELDKKSTQSLGTAASMVAAWAQYGTILDHDFKPAQPQKPAAQKAKPPTSAKPKSQPATTTHTRNYTTAPKSLIPTHPFTHSKAFTLRIKPAPFTTNRLLSRSLKFAAFGLSLGALGAYAWLRG